MLTVEVLSVLLHYLLQNLALIFQEPLEKVGFLVSNISSPYMGSPLNKPGGAMYNILDINALVEVSEC